MKKVLQVLPNKYNPTLYLIRKGFNNEKGFTSFT